MIWLVGIFMIWFWLSELGKVIRLIIFRLILQGIIYLTIPTLIISFAFWGRR